MEFKTTKEDTKLTVAIAGRLDTLSAPDLEKGLEPELAGITDLVLDLKDLEYISSAGLRVLLATHKALSKKGGMKVTNVNEMIMEIFEVTGFCDILIIE
jgi:anti-sigma B factor antagonist